MERVISAVIPAYGEIGIVKNSVISLATQWIPDNTFSLDIIIVNDNPQRDFSYFTSEEFIKLLNNNISIIIIGNSDNYGQGISRQIGIENARSNWVLLCDEDDMYAPNAIYRYWEILNKEHCGGSDGKPIALIAAPLYSFDENEQRNIITAKNIWPNAKLLNRQFLRDNNIHFPEGKNSHRSEDYPFCKMLDYAIENNSNYKAIYFDDSSDTFYYWIPNKKSRTRIDKYYSALLTPFTMNSSCMIYNYEKWYNAEHNIVKDKDEWMKHEILNMNVYAYYNYSSWLKSMKDGWMNDEKCLEEDWELYKKSLKELREELLVYWNEIVPSDIYTMLSDVRLHSDIQFIEPWICSFEEWIKKKHKTLCMSFDEIKDYCSKLEFDEADHEKHSSYVIAWNKRNNPDIVQ